MYLGVISDTHGNIFRVQQAMQTFREFEVSRIIHCGDIGSSEVVPLFRGIATEFVFGNCDGNSNVIREAILREHQTCHDFFGHIAVEGKLIAFLHGHDQSLFDRELASQRWDMICYGHTHQASLRMSGNTIVMNPGAIARAVTPSVAVVRLPELDVTQIHIR
ncbi:MAG: YfcE family phosphodiesterase [Planctomycetaceae bacterium]|nr:YfcE family phosphodiesterase [Planctomycetaceae bacterium]